MKRHRDTAEQYPAVPKGKHKMFAYGTLQEPVIQAWLWGEIQDGKEATLEGYRREGSTIYWIVPDTTKEVEGRIYELNADQVINTDRYEGAGYKRVRAMISGFGGVYVYAANNSRKN